MELQTIYIYFDEDNSNYWASMIYRSQLVCGKSKNEIGSINELKKYKSDIDNYSIEYTQMKPAEQFNKFRVIPLPQRSREGM